MSHGEEFLADTAYEREKAMEQWERITIRAEMEASHGIWRTKDGQVLSVKEMQTSHIRNCINMLVRHKNPLTNIYVPMFEKELAERKEE